MIEANRLLCNNRQRLSPLLRSQSVLYHTPMLCQNQNAGAGYLPSYSDAVEINRWCCTFPYLLSYCVAVKIKSLVLYIPFLVRHDCSEHCWRVPKAQDPPSSSDTSTPLSYDASELSSLCVNMKSAMAAYKRC